MLYLLNKSNLLIVQIIFFTLHAAKFNPEDYHFSKQSTIKEWVHPLHNSQEKIEYLQSIIAKEMPYIGSADLYGISYNVKNNQKDTRYFGKTFPIITTPQLGCLKDIRARDGKAKKPLTVLEVGGAGGAFAAKIAFALGPDDTLYINDLSTPEINKAINRFADIQKSMPLNPAIHFDIGDGTNFSERNPELINSIDFIYVQNVEHFMNPEQHQLFAKEMLKLLAPNGRIFCVAHTIPTSSGCKGNPFFDCYIKQKHSVTYPMFLNTIQEYWQAITNNNVENFFATIKVTKATKAEPDAECFAKSYDTQIIQNNGNTSSYTLILCEKLMNYFTPKIYYDAYQKAAAESNINIQKIEGGFLDYNGTFYPVFDNTKYLSCAMMVIQRINNNTDT